MQTFRQYETENQAYWTNRAAGYSEVNKSELNSGQHQVWGGVLFEQISRQYPGRKPGELSVLDIGCGPGFFSGDPGGDGVSGYRCGLYGIHAGGGREERGDLEGPYLFSADERGTAGIPGEPF